MKNDEIRNIWDRLILDVCIDGIGALMMETISELKGELKMDRLVTHIKRIGKKDGIVKIMSVPDVVQEISGDPLSLTVRTNLERYGSIMHGDFVYHAIDTDRALFEILGRSVAFKMKDGSSHLIKVQAIGFTGSIAGIDDEGMYMVITIHDIDEYKVTGITVQEGNITGMVKAE